MATVLYVRTGNAGADPDVSIPDLGVTIATGASWTILSASAPGDPFGNSGQFTAREIRDSDDLYNAISGSTLEWSKNGSDIAAAGDYVADYMLAQDFTDDFLDLTDGEFTFPNESSSPASGVTGQAFWNTTDDDLFIWDGDEWANLSSTIDHGSLEGLSDDDHAQYLQLTGDAIRNALTGTINASSGVFVLPQDVNVSGLSGSEGTIAWDTDDDMLYIHDGSEWQPFTDLISGIYSHHELAGLDDDDHTQYLTEGRHDSLPADNPHSVTFTQAVTADGGTDISAAEAETLTDGSNADSLHAHTSAGLGLDHGGLVGLGDDDHPQYTDWDHDETISGVWTFETDTNEPAFVITPDTSEPSTKLADGAIAIIDGLLSVYDETRGKWLSVDRQKFIGGRRGNATNVYLRSVDGIAMSQTGYRMARNGTIVGLFAQTEGSETWQFEIRKNGNTSVETALQISAATGDQEITTNVDFSQGDELQFVCSGTAIAAPLGGIEVAWRE